ncbi:MAG: hypothetical protein K8L91_07135 [Anaerolineae bacterium]|nr:hypothetical protein [Anaerolineae bacterium]
MKPMEDFNQRLAAAQDLPLETRINALLEVVRAYRPILMLMHETLYELERAIDQLHPLRTRLEYMRQLEVVMQQCGYSRIAPYLDKLDFVRRALDEE